MRNLGETTSWVLKNPRGLFEWIKKAEDDLRVAQHEMEYDQPSYDAICFHSQQCAEKYLKGFLTEYSVEFPRTHMLVDETRKS